MAEDAQVLNLMRTAWSLPAAHGDHVVTLARADQRVAAGLTLARGHHATTCTAA
jgi:hypothetical protein